MSSDREFEKELAELGAGVEYPPTPDLDRAVRRRLEAEGGGRAAPRGLWSTLADLRWAAAAAVFLIIAVPVLSLGLRAATDGWPSAGQGGGGGAAGGAEEAAGNGSSDGSLAESAEDVPESGGAASPAGAEVRVLRAEVGRDESPGATAEQIAELARGNNDLAFDLYRAESGDENLVLSPYSVSLAFSMAYAGARGATEEQMASVLNYLPQEEHHPAFNALERRISGLGDASEGARSGEPFRLEVANSAWGQRGHGFNRAYLRTLAEHYGAGLRTLDFGRPEKASEHINSWVEDQTEGRIENLFAPGVLDPGTRLVLANAVYFRASWLSPFYETRDGSFELADGSEVTVPLMHQEMDFPYAKGDGYQAVRLPYAGGEADMLVILPEKGRFGEVEERLGARFLEEVNRGLDEEYVRLAMPRFGFETELDLAGLLAEMGMGRAFSGAANFGGMSREGNLMIDDALQKANITVDERGTEAAAATGLDMTLEDRPQPREMTLDRPFIFAITERDTGTILFLGRVTDPSV